MFPAREYPTGRATVFVAPTFTATLPTNVLDRVPLVGADLTKKPVPTGRFWFELQVPPDLLEPTYPLPFQVNTEALLGRVASNRLIKSFEGATNGLATRVYLPVPAKVEF